MRGGVLYTAVATVLALLVALVGSTVSDGAGRAAVWAGAGAGLVVQLLGFWLFFVVALPKHHALAYVLGMVVRFGFVGLVAFVGIPLLGLPAAPMLFSLVTVFFVTTLAEPVILQIDSRTRR